MFANSVKKRRTTDEKIFRQIAWKKKNSKKSIISYLQKQCRKVEGFKKGGELQMKGFLDI